jgi:hypothetical protein
MSDASHKPMRFQRSAEGAKRDGWDYAEIVSRFVSGIVIAILGIFIPATIQKSQQQIAKGQATAQLELERARADSERLVKQGELASALIESLVSAAPKRREIALITLRSAVPADVYERVLLTLVRNDESENVRVAALTEIQSSANPYTAAALLSLANEKELLDSKKIPESERTSWLKAARTISLRSELGPDTCLYLAVAPGFAAYEAPGAGGGFFTTALLEAMVHTFKRTPVISSAESFGSALTSRVLFDSNEIMKPFIYCGIRARESPLFPDKRTDGKVVAVVIGIGSYESTQLRNLPFAKLDAQRLADVLKAQDPKNEVLTVYDKVANRQNIRGLLKRARELVSPSDTFVLYYSGHAISDKKGYLEPIYYDYPHTEQLQSRGMTISSDEYDEPLERGPLNIRAVRSYLETVDARLKILMFDSCYPEALKLNSGQQSGSGQALTLTTR